MSAPSPVSLRLALQLARLAGTRLLVTNLLLQVAQGLVPLLGLVAMQRFLDAVAAALHGDPLANSQPPAQRIGLAIGFAAAVAFGGALLRALAAQVGERHARLVADRCALDLQRHAAELDLQQLEDPAVADLLHRAGGEASQRPVRVVHNLAALVLAIVTFAALGLCLWTAAPWLPILVALAAVPQAIVRLRAARAQLVWQEQRTEAQRELGYRTGLLGSRAAAKDLRLCGLGPAIADDLAVRRRALTDEQLALQQTRSWAEAFAQIAASAAMFAAYWFLAMRTLDGALSLGGLLLQAQAVQRAQNGLRDCLLALSGLREDRLFLGHRQAFLAVQPRITAPAEPRAVPTRDATAASTPELELEQVQFAYRGAAQPVLRSASLALRRGERVLLTGPNGAGKSTIVRLLTRLCDPDQGVVRCRGVDVRAFEPRTFRSELSVFFQDAAAFEFTARDNLALAAPGRSEAELLQFADLVGIGDKLRQLPRGLDTRLGRGFHGAVELSVGEWRRLLLARALARPSAVLLLDEPFAFLDAASQQRLAAALQSLPRERTLLVVDHRAPSAGQYDRVLRCDDGRVDEH